MSLLSYNLSLFFRTFTYIKHVKYISISALLALSLLSIDSATAKEEHLSGFEGYLYQFDRQFIDSFIGYNSANHLAAVSSTYVLVNYDIDWHYYRFFEQHRQLQYLAFPAVILGGIGPIAIPLYLHHTAVKTHDRKRLYTAYSIGQAAILSVAITSVYKSVTGRLEPGLFREERSLEQSKQFEFGFWNNGIFNGWPSGHATTAMAIATSLSEMYPEKKMAHLWWTLGALYISFGISTNIHWLSDAVAGSLIGYGIGKTVGKAYYTKLKGQKNTQMNFLPYVRPDSIGIMLSKTF